MATKNEKDIWNYLLERVGTPYGVAAIMGNLKAESSMNSLCKTGKNKVLTAKEYVNAIDNGDITKEEFANDGIAFGLAQWLFHTRKEMLYDFVKSRNNESIGAVDLQLDYLLYEMKNYYRTLWELITVTKPGNVISVEAVISVNTDAVMLKYEKPANVSEKAKEKRRKYAMEYLETFAPEDAKTPEPVAEPTPEPEPEPETPVEDIPKPEPEPEPDPIPTPVIKPSTKKYVVTTANKVFIRIGNGVEYSAITRLERKGAAAYEWVATAENGWHAFKYNNRVAWVSGDFSEIMER